MADNPIERYVQEVAKRLDEIDGGSAWRVAACSHQNFEAAVNVNRIQDGRDQPGRIIGYAADIRVRCIDCQVPFAFVGLPMGLAPDRPTISADALKLRAPLMPARVPEPAS